MTEPLPRSAAPLWFRRYMVLVATGGNAFFYMQAWTIFETQSAKDVNVWAFVVATCTVASWFTYGIMLRDRIIIIANIIATIGSGAVVAGCLVYG